MFYGWWDWRFTGLLAFSTIVDFQVGKYLHATTDQAKRRRWLLVSLVVNLGLLGVFKYLNFFIDSAVEVSTALGLHASKKHLSLILPVGISFYTFQTLSYTLDIYRKQLEPEPSFVRFAAYVAFFPQLVAGPIVRAAEFLPQLRKDPRFDANRFESGMSLIAWGFVKKVVVADSLASVVDHRFRVPEAHDALSLGLGVFCYAFQIYADFSGYSDIAIGTARLLGYDFPENFRRPYFSTSFREFWRRWHITLSTWLRDYLYIPLGGNRTPGYRTYRNLMLTMLLGGLWHGANWTFVVWGGLHGTYLIAERLLAAPLTRATARLPQRLTRAVQMVTVFALTCLTWVFFRSQTVAGAATIVRTITTLDGLNPAAVQSKFLVVKGLVLIAGLITVDYLIERGIHHRLSRPVRAIGFAACLWTIAFLGSFSGSQFIYFQF
ncbi:MAG: MBOAT family protein [Polyangiaceae bacterium]